MEQGTIHTVGINRHVYYGICETAASESKKIVCVKNPTLYEQEIEGESEPRLFLDLNEGDQLIVSFSERNTTEYPTIALSTADGETDIGTHINSGRITIDGLDGPFLGDYWEAGQIITFTYTVNTNQVGWWKINNAGPASENRYGTVKLADSTDADSYDTDENTAASIPRIQKIIDNSMKKLSLAWGNKFGLLTLNYNGSEISSDDDAVGIPVPQTTSDLPNDGPPDPDGERNAVHYVYRDGNTINEFGATLTVGTINGTLDGSNLVNTSVVEAKLAANAVTTNKIKDSNVTTNKLYDGAVTEAKLAANAVTTNKIKDSSVTTNKLYDGAVTNAKLASGIDGNKIIVGSIPTDRIYGLDNYVRNYRCKFTTRAFACDVHIDANSNMIEVRSPGTRSSNSNAYMNIGIGDGWIPLGIVAASIGHSSQGGDMASPAMFQDFYLASGTQAHFHVQTAKTAGWVSVSLTVLYYK